MFELPYSLFKYLILFNRHHRRPKSVLLERSILMAAVRIFTFQLVQQGFTQHSISLAVNKDDALFALFLVLFHHFTKLIQLVIQYFAVAHAAGVIQQLANMQVNFDNPILATTLDDRLRFGRSICRFFCIKASFSSSAETYTCLAGWSFRTISYTKAGVSKKTVCWNVCSL